MFAWLVLVALVALVVLVLVLALAPGRTRGPRAPSLRLLERPPRAPPAPREGLARAQVRQRERVLNYIKLGQEEGARLVTGGKAPADLPGFYVEPTLFADVTNDMRIAQEEIFGPVISAISFNDTDELVKRANATTFGLGSGVWTRDVSKAHKLAKSIRAGSVWVNCYQAMDPAVPFGGYKMSGYGRESGKQHVEEYLNVKAVWIKTA